MAAVQLPLLVNHVLQGLSILVYLCTMMGMACAGSVPLLPSPPPSPTPGHPLPVLGASSIH